MKQRILFLDDDVFFLKLVEKFFKDWDANLDVRLESSAYKMLEEIKNNPNSIDLVVTDYNMPEMDGLAFTVEAKKTIADIPIILLTANKDRKVALAAIREGVFDFIEKPFDHDEFRAVISRGLEFSKLSKERLILMERLRKGGKEILRLSKELDIAEGKFN